MAFKIDDEELASLSLMDLLIQFREYLLQEPRELMLYEVFNRTEDLMLRWKQ